MPQTTLVPSQPTLEVAADTIRNGGGAVNVGVTDGVIVLEGTASRDKGNWFPIAVVAYADYNSYATMNSAGGYYFDVVGLDAVRLRLDSGTTADVELTVKEG